jgi:hypothetical protein
MLERNFPNRTFGALVYIDGNGSKRSGDTLLSAIASRNVTVTVSGTISLLHREMSL